MSPEKWSNFNEKNRLTLSQFGTTLGGRITMTTAVYGCDRITVIMYGAMILLRIRPSMAENFAFSISLTKLSMNAWLAFPEEVGGQRTLSKC